MVLMSPHAYCIWCNNSYGVIDPECKMLFSDNLANANLQHIPKTLVLIRSPKGMFKWEKKPGVQNLVSRDTGPLKFHLNHVTKSNF
jgi:hypothetical protein